MSNLFTFANRPPRQDFIVLAGQASPGVCEITGHAIANDWDIRKGYGLSGAYTVFTGMNLSKFTVEIKLWEDPKTPTNSQWTDWAEFASVLTPPKTGQRPQALSIVHPALVLPPLNITSVVFLGGGGFEQSETGLWRTKLEFLQFKKPLLALAKPTSTQPPVAKPTPVAADAADLAIQQLKKQFLELSQ